MATARPISNGNGDPDVELQPMPNDLNVTPIRPINANRARSDSFIAASAASSPERMMRRSVVDADSGGLGDESRLKIHIPATPVRTQYTREGIKIPKRKEIKQMTSIEQAKDRAQITATTAMSIVHVALLKDVLDAGPEGNQYYKWSLGFILTALILQILAGLVSLYIALLRYYYTEYKDDFLDDCMKTCFPFRIRRSHYSTETEMSNWIDKPLRSNGMSNKNKRTDLSSSSEDRDDHESRGCCPIECTSMRFADYEYQVLDLYDDMCEQVIRADLQTANVEIETTWLVEKVTRLNNELQKYEDADINDEVANKEYLQTIREELQEAQIMREDMEQRNKMAKQIHAQSVALEKHVETIQEERVLKRATFWQNWLNIMLYTVFILNAMIAGIGLANRQVIVVAAPTNATS